MSVQFSGWEVVDDGASFPGVELGPSQTPQNRGIYAMYHGTSVASARLIIANGFKQSTGGMLGPGVYVSREMKKASNYPLKSNPSDRVVLNVRVRVGCVKRIDKDNHPMQKTWHSHGYDTAWVPPKCGMKSVPSGLEEDCVFDPKRVKVVGIAKAPNTNVEKELKQLLGKKSPKEEEVVVVLWTSARCVRGRRRRVLYTSSSSAGSVGKTSAFSCPSITVHLNPDMKTEEGGLKNRVEQ
uniref:Grass carp reovirus (GCRV)-induced gene 2p n=1 Tax=Lates calcarifer TaxID=8187 RepID=A0A4W6GAL6_LATCA